MEDLHGLDHKMSTLEDCTEVNLGVLILSLPHPPKHHKHSYYYHLSKDNESNQNEQTEKATAVQSNNQSPRNDANRKVIYNISLS